MLRFVAGLPDSARRGTQRLLRRTFNTSCSVLVDPLADPALARLRRIVADMRQDTNLLTQLVASTVDEVVRGHHATAASLPLVIYNPCLSSHPALRMWSCRPRPSRSGLKMKPSPLAALATTSAT